MNKKQIIKLNDIYSMYRNKDYSYETLYDGEIFLSYPKCFNDPFDCFVLIDKEEFNVEYLRRKFDHSLIQRLIEYYPGKPIFDLIDFVYLYKKADPDGFPKDFEWIMNEDLDLIKKDCLKKFNEYYAEINKVRNRFGIACFTINKPNKNMVMWAHYAENYDGFCASYNFGNVKFDIGTERCDKYAYYILKNFKKVDYTKEFPRIDVKKLLDIPIEKIEKNKYILRCIKKTLNKKYSQWQYEKEYRLIIDRNDKNIKKTFMSEKGFKIKFPYLRELYLYSQKYTLQKKLVIESIADKYGIKYLFLTTNQGSIELIEDKTSINEHNIKIEMLKHINNC